MTLTHGSLFQLAMIFILGITAQWTAWRLRIPSILLLLITGVVVGPGTGFIQPDKLFGDIFLPIVSLSVATILYEGGLNLRFRELRKLEVRSAFFRIATISALCSWVIGAVAAHSIIGFRWPVATLLGAILIVTGPTVIGPMLRHLRLRGRVNTLLKWEGIVVDPLGAILAVFVFAVVRSSELNAGISEAAFDLGITATVGVSIGCVAAGILVLGLRRFWIPDPLHSPVSLMLMFAAFVTANALYDEAGLLAVTVMGMALANQTLVSIRHVVEFKDTLTVLLISCLFVVLTARLQPHDLRGLGWESLLFASVMILVARPVSILAATIGSSLPWRERLFLGWMAPRGIVAASVTSVFALELGATGYPRAVEMVPITFLVVFMTVLVYGLSAGPLARHLQLVHANPQGVLFIGAHAWARAIADALQCEDCPVLLIDSDWENFRLAQMAGLPCHHGSALAEITREEMDLGGLGRMLAITSNNEVNSLACLRYIEDFGRQEVYQLSLPVTRNGRHEAIPLEHRGRLLFGEAMTYTRICSIFESNPIVKRTKLTNQFDFEALQTEYGDALLPLFILRPDKSLLVYTENDPPKPRAGDIVISLIGSVNQSVPNKAVNPSGGSGRNH